MKTHVHIFNHTCGTTENVTELIDALTNTPINAGGCFDTLLYRLTGPQGCCRAGANPTLFQPASINISTTYDGRAPFTPCFKCVCDGNIPAQNPHKICPKNLMAGKCVDEYMRNTVGKILYPQFYAKVK